MKTQNYRKRPRVTSPLKCARKLPLNSHAAALPTLDEAVKNEAALLFEQMFPMDDGMRVVSIRRLFKNEYSYMRAYIRDFRVRTDTALQHMAYMKETMLSRSKRVQRLYQNVDSLGARLCDMYDSDSRYFYPNEATDCLLESFQGDDLETLQQCCARISVLKARFENVQQEIYLELLALNEGFQAKRLVCDASFSVKARVFRVFFLKHLTTPDKLKETLRACTGVADIRYACCTEKQELKDFTEFLELFSLTDLPRRDTSFQETVNFARRVTSLLPAYYYNASRLPSCIGFQTPQKTVRNVICGFPDCSGRIGQVVAAIRYSFTPYFLCGDKHKALVAEYIRYMQEQALIHSEKARDYAQLAYNLAVDDAIAKLEDDLKGNELRRIIEGFEARIDETKRCINTIVLDYVHHALPIDRFSDQMLADERNAIHLYESQYNGLSKDQIKYEYQSLYYEVLHTAILSNLTKNRQYILHHQATTSQVYSVDLILKQVDDALREATELYLYIDDEQLVQKARRLIFQENAAILHEIKMNQRQESIEDDAHVAKKKKAQAPKNKESFRTWAEEKKETKRNIAIRQTLQCESRIMENDFYK